MARERMAKLSKYWHLKAADAVFLPTDFDIIKNDHLEQILSVIKIDHNDF